MGMRCGERNVLPDAAVESPARTLNYKQQHGNSRHYCGTWNGDARDRQTVSKAEKYDLCDEELAAIVIQKNFRGYLGRKEYLDRLYEHIAEEEAAMSEKEGEQVAEGEMLIESYRLEREVNDDSVLRSNNERYHQSQAITIQRAWRQHRDNVPQTDNDDQHTMDNAGFVATQQLLDGPDSFQSASFDDRFDGGADLLCDFDPFGRDHYNVNDDCDTDLSSMRLVDNRLPTDEDHEYERVSFALPDTDWSTIEAVLRTESGIDSPEEDNFDAKPRSNPHLQMVFVDDDCDSFASDAESEPDVRVYLYDQDEDHVTHGTASSSRCSTVDGMEAKGQRQVDSRDSGCVPGDLIDLNIEHVTDVVRPPGGVQSAEPAVESTRVLDSLVMHEELERRKEERATQRKRKSLVQDNVTVLSKRELQLLREELERKLREASDMLVEELRSRDVLHAEQDALLVDVEDWTKMNQDAPTTSIATKTPTR